jgi:hypothetical protein
MACVRSRSVVLTLTGKDDNLSVSLRRNRPWKQQAVRYLVVGRGLCCSGDFEFIV